MSDARPIAAFKAPTCLVGQLNGAVDPQLLARVGNDSAAYSRTLVAAVAAAMTELHRYCSAHGIALTTTGRGRTLQGQWDIFGGYRARYRPCTFEEYTAAKRHPGRAAIWRPTQRAIVIARLGEQSHPIPDATYWCKVPNPNGSWPYNAAVPATSNHGWNCADDLAEFVGGRVVALRATTVAFLCSTHPATGLPIIVAFGFAWQTVADPPHVHWIMGDETPPALKENELQTALAAIYIPTPGKVSAVNTKWFALLPDGHVRWASGADVAYAVAFDLPRLSIDGDGHYDILVNDWRATSPQPIDTDGRPV